MAVIKVACSKCGQRVSGDDTFLGTTVNCPICETEIPFPTRSETPAAGITSEDPRPIRTEDLPRGVRDSDVAEPSRAPEPAIELPPASHNPPPQAAQPWANQQPPAGQPQPPQQQPPAGYPSALPQQGYPQQAPPHQGYAAAPAPPQPAPESDERRPRRRNRQQKDAMPAFVMVMGVLALLSGPCIIGALPGIAAVVMGHFTLMRLSHLEDDLHPDDTMPGKGTTLTGLILGYLSLPLALGGAVALKKLVLPWLEEQQLEAACLLIQQPWV